MLQISELDQRNVIAKLQALENLPTVRRGLKALGMSSVLDWFTERERIRKAPSPYTHPLQMPQFFVPGLSSRAFYQRELFAWADDFEQHCGAIQAELARALDRDTGFQPYRNVEDGLFQMPNNAHGSERHQISAWNMMYFHYLGQRVEENCALCPRTAELLEAIPRLPGGTVSSFSALNPGTNITPHCGLTNAVTRVHLALKIPAGCRLRVGEQITGWQEGKLLFFDDSYEHQVWHTGTQTRFVLFFDVWHPDWQDDEVPELAKIIRFDGEGGLSDLSEKMQQMRRSDHDFLAGRAWWC